MCNRENARYSPIHQIYLLSTHKDHRKWDKMTNFDQCNVDANDRYYCQTWLVKILPCFILILPFPMEVLWLGWHGPRQKEPGSLSYRMEK